MSPAPITHMETNVMDQAPSRHEVHQALMLRIGEQQTAIRSEIEQQRQRALAHGAAAAKAAEFQDFLTMGGEQRAAAACLNRVQALERQLQALAGEIDQVVQGRHPDMAEALHAGAEAERGRMQQEHREALAAYQAAVSPELIQIARRLAESCKGMRLPVPSLAAALSQGGPL